MWEDTAHTILQRHTANQEELSSLRRVAHRDLALTDTDRRVKVTAYLPYPPHRV
jgi:hypothetical protein